MPFFLPDELVQFQYFETDEPDIKAGPYRHEIDLAFFVVNFGFSKRDYLDLTTRERAFIYKAWEDKVVRESQLSYDATFLAIANFFRKKGKSIKKLWEKKKTRRVDPQEYRQLVHEIEKEDISGILDTIRRR